MSEWTNCIIFAKKLFETFVSLIKHGNEWLVTLKQHVWEAKYGYLSLAAHSHWQQRLMFLPIFVFASPFQKMDRFHRMVALLHHSLEPQMVPRLSTSVLLMPSGTCFSNININFPFITIQVPNFSLNSEPRTTVSTWEPSIDEYNCSSSVNFHNLQQ